MPTKRTHRLSRRRVSRVLRPDEKSYLLDGIDLGQFSDEGSARDAWRLHRVPLLLEWISEHAGTRPYMWWEVERPVGKLRYQIAGPPLLEGAPIYRGYPSHWPHRGLIFETEIEFLRRNHLLTREEEREFPALLNKARIEQKAAARRGGFTEGELDQIFSNVDSDANDSDGRA
jgi:hypothetical protein